MPGCSIRWSAISVQTRQTWVQTKSLPLIWATYLRILFKDFLNLITRRQELILRVATLSIWCATCWQTVWAWQKKGVSTRLTTWQWVQARCSPAWRNDYPQWIKQLNWYAMVRKSIHLHLASRKQICWFVAVILIICSLVTLWAMTNSRIWPSILLFLILRLALIGSGRQQKSKQNINLAMADVLPPVCRRRVMARCYSLWMVFQNLRKTVKWQSFRMVPAFSPEMLVLEQVISDNMLSKMTGWTLSFSFRMTAFITPASQPTYGLSQKTNL